MKKSESDDESEKNERIQHLYFLISRLRKRMKEMQAEIEAMQRGDNTGAKHKNDGGWFD